MTTITSVKPNAETTIVNGVIDIVDPQRGVVRETPAAGTSSNVLTEQHVVEFNRRFSNLREAATTSEFPALLRDGLKAILFDSYQGVPTTYQDIVQMQPSSKPGEDYLELNTLGTLPEVAEGAPYPTVDSTVDRTVRVANKKYGMIFEVTREMILFDRLNQIRQFAVDMGRAAKTTREQAVYSTITTAGSYDRNSTTSDNDVGANTAATTFSAANLITAYRTLATMKDRKSGRYLGILPDTLIVTPGLAFAAKQLLLSPEIFRQHGNTTAEVYGTGSQNPLRGLINRIFVSPFLGTSWQWILYQSGRLFTVFQEVEPMNLYTDDIRSVQSEGYFKYDVVRYRVDDFFGVGIVNSRYAYYSSSTTAPAVG